MYKVHHTEFHINGHRNDTLTDPSKYDTHMLIHIYGDLEHYLLSKPGQSFGFNNIWLPHLMCSINSTLLNKVYCHVRFPSKPTVSITAINNTLTMIYSEPAFCLLMEGKRYDIALVKYDCTY
jgi:hypothetical protein